MNRFHQIIPFLLSVLLHPFASAQLPTADVTRLKPPAARAGETVNVALYGSNLDDLTELRFTHPGITAIRATTAATEFYPEPRPAGSSFSVSVSADVPPGIYEARGVGYFGYSTSRPFLVAAKDSNEVVEEGDHSTQDKAMAVELNSVVNGDVPSRGIDWYRFKAKAGQRVLLEIHAERIDSRMDGQLIVVDAAGREVARNRDRYGRDPFVEVSPAKDTEYFVAVSDILYRGGAEHFYRLSISDRPHIDFIFPPAGEPGSKGTYTIYGRNLSASSMSNVTLDGRPLEAVQVEIELPTESTTPKSHHAGQPRQGLLRGFDYRYKNSNVVRIGFATSPVVAEVTNQNLQVINVPNEVAGRFDRPDDEDTFRFLTEKGKTYCIEVIAERMASAVDPYITVQQVNKDDEGNETLKQVADNDDMPSFFSVRGLESINADTCDAALSFMSEGGVYQVTIINQFGDGGPAKLYRLAIREPTPDFDLVATTETTIRTGRTGYSVTPHLRKNAKWGIQIFCPRQDQFEGDIVITAEDLPTGVTARPLTLSGKVERGMFVVAADENAKPWSGDIRLVGRAKVGDRELVREARFASLVWGHIFADSIRVRSRLTERIPLSVNGHEPTPAAIEPAEDKEWTVEVGKTLELPIKVANFTRKGSLTVEVQELHGVLRSPATVNIPDGGTEGKLAINFTRSGNFQVEPGRYQFCLLGTGIANYSRNPVAAEKAVAEKQRLEALAKALQIEVEEGDPQAAAKSKRLEAVLKQAIAAAESAKKSALPKDAKFSVSSDPITVNVVQPAKK